MKIQIVSDVHVEISKENFNIYLNPKASIVALLGDIGNKKKLNPQRLSK
jgi:predicted phosphodiesterase